VALLIVGLGIFVLLRRRRTRISRGIDEGFVMPSYRGSPIAEKMGTSIAVISVPPGELETIHSREIRGGNPPEPAADLLTGRFELSDGR